MPGARDGLTSIVIVVADSGPLLRESVASALASTAPVEIIVVDNASADGEPDRLRAAHAGDARVRVIANESNLGFGVACNRGAAIADGDALLFLNPDCLIEPGTVAALRAVMAADARIGLLGIDIRTPDGASARGNRRRDPTLGRAAMSFSGLARFEERWPALAGVEMPAREALPPVEPVDAVSGACMLVPRRVFETAGGFDPGYFLHVEDLDLCRRVRDAGRVVAIANGLSAVHAQGSSSLHRPVFVAWHKHRGMWRYFRRFDPAARNPLIGAIALAALWTHFVIALPGQAISIWRRGRARAALRGGAGSARPL
jgi:GT2 family glycosyltransferase